MDGAFIEDENGEQICFGIPQRAFHLFALSLDKGPNFDVDQQMSFWMGADKQATGMVFRLHDTFGHLVMRRREDQRWVVTAETQDFASPEIAAGRMVDAMRIGEPPEPIPPGSPSRPSLYEGKGNETYQVLTDAGVLKPLGSLIHQVVRGSFRVDVVVEAGMIFLNFRFGHDALLDSRPPLIQAARYALRNVLRIKRIRGFIGCPCPGAVRLD